MKCSNMNLSDKLEIVVIETPNVTVTSYDDSLCTGEQPVVDLSVTSIGTGDNFQIWYRLTSTGTTRSWTGTGSGSHTFTVADAVSNTGSAVITQNILIDSIRNLSNTPTTGVACTESLGISAGVSVYPASEGGDATGTATVCNGFNQGTVSVVNQVGDVVKWQYRVGTGGWTDIFNSDTTDYVYNNLSVETEFRAIVQSGPCSEAASNPVTISIQPLPIVTINNTDPTKVCKGNDVELSFEVSNVANGGSGTDWTITYTLNNVTQTLDGSGNGTKTVDFTGVLVDTEVELIKIESRGVNGMQCDNLDLSDKLQVKVIENPILTISGHSDTLCNGSKPSVDVNISGISSSDRFRVFYKLGATGASRTYENKGPGNYTINFVDAVTNNGSTVITETLYIDSVRNIDDVPSAGDLCTGLLGLTRDVDVYPNSVGGDATGDAIVCKDENSGWVEVVNLVGNVVKWQYKEAGGSWTDIFNTDTIAYMYENLSVETRFRAIVKSGPCTEATSTDALIEIRELPEVSINNTDPTYVCYGGSITLSVDVTKVGAGSSGSDWTINYTINGVAASFDGSGNGTATTTISNITADAEIELVSIVSRGSAGMQCNNRDLSDKLEVKVIENPTASISSVESPVCHGETVDFKVEVSNVGTSENWSLVYKLGSGGSNRTLTGTGAGIFAFTTTDLVSNTGTTSNTTDIILVSIENTTNQPTSGANCSSTLSDSESVTVFPETVGGTTSGTATVCKGDNTGWVTLSGHVGDVVKWQSSTNNGVTWSDIANTNDSLQFTNVSVETQYRAVVMSGPCDEETSSTVTISIKELPTVTIVNNTFNVCDGSTATINYFLGNVDAGQTWAITYKVNGTTQSTDLTGTGPGSSSNPFSLTIGPLNSTTDVEFVNVRTTSGDPQCDNAITEKATVTVLDNPSASITSDNDTICEGGNGIVKINVDNVKNGERWILTYDDGVNTNVTKDGFGPGSFTFTTPTLNTAGTYKFKLNSIVNASLNPSCSKTLADSVDIIVDQETEGGTVTPATSSVCLGDNTGILTWNPGVGDIVRWEYSDDGGNTWNNLANNTTTLTYNDIEKTTMYRVYVRSGVCAGKYSTVATVTVLDQPVATISGAPKVCPNTPAVFTLTVSDVPAGEGWTVTFLENGAQRTTTGTGSGTFTLTTRGYPYTTTPSTITVSLEEIRNDVSGCVNDDLNSSAIATITPNPVPAFDAENACQDTLVVFDNKSAIAEGAISGYVWYFGDGDSSKAVSPTHAYDNAGAYRVRLVAISDNGCIAETEKVIDIYHNPTADFTFTNVCQNRDFMPVDASTVGGGSITDWMWRFGDLNTSTDQNPTHRYASSGTYDVTLKVTTDNGCTDEVSKEATIYILPEASFVAQPVCEDDEMDFINTSAIGYGTMTYEWDFDNDGTTNSTATNPGHTFTGTPSFGDFDVQMVATSNNGCRDTTVRTVTVYANPVADFIADRVCFGETTNFGSRAFVPSPSTDIIVEYFWDFADTSFSTGRDPSHTYDRPNENGYGVTLRVVTDKGCEDSETKDVVVDELPEFDLTATPNPICDGDSSVIEVTNASTTLTEFNWNTGATTSSIVARTQGTYSVIVTEDPALGGCQAADSVFLEVWPLPAVDAGRDTTINKGQVVQLMGQPDNMATYTWTPADVLDLPNDQNPITVGESVAGFNQGMMETTTFTLVVEDANGCSNTDDVTVTVLDEFSLIVYNLVTPNFDGDNDTWIIENILAYPEAEVAIFNRYGMEVFKTTGYQNTWDGKYEGKNLPDGAYYYVITIPGGTDSKATVYKGAINLVRTTN
jgi:gliding motility-associated-like protein